MTSEPGGNPSGTPREGFAGEAATPARCPWCHWMQAQQAADRCEQCGHPLTRTDVPGAVQ